MLFRSPSSFSGTATDDEDGDMSLSIQWSSSLDGTIGTGALVSKSNLSVGTHIITAQVTDSGGLTDSKAISITVNEPATVKIMSPVADSDQSGKFNIVAEVVGNSPVMLNLEIGDYQSILNTSPYEWSYHSKDLLPGENTIRIELLAMDGSLIDFDEIIVFNNKNGKSYGGDSPSDKCTPGKEKSGKC